MLTKSAAILLSFIVMSVVAPDTGEFGAEQPVCTAELVFKAVKYDARKAVGHTEKKPLTAEDPAECASHAFVNLADYAIWSKSKRSCILYKSEEFTPVCDVAQLKSESSLRATKLVISCMTCRNADRRFLF